MRVLFVVIGAFAESDSLLRCGRIVRKGKLLRQKEKILRQKVSQMKKQGICSLCVLFFYIDRAIVRRERGP